MCFGLPEEFCILLKYARSLEFKQKPNYDGIKKLFKDLLFEKKFSLDWKFCWEGKCEEKNEEDVKESNP